MEISFDITKKRIWFAVFLVVSVFSVSLAISYNTNDPATFGHTPDEITGGTFPDSQYTFDSDLEIQDLVVGNAMTIGTSSRTTWPTGHGLCFIYGANGYKCHNSPEVTVGFTHTGVGAVCTDETGNIQNMGFPFRIVSC